MTDDDQGRSSELRFDIRLETPRLFEPSLNGRASKAAASGILDETARFLAVERDATEPQSFDLAELWNALGSGAWRFRDTFATEERYFAVVQCVPVARPLRRRHLDVLERVLLGEAPKVVAIELRVATSTVAGALQACLLKMGLSGRLSSAPVILTMAACAARRPKPSAVLGRLTRLEPDDDRYRVVSVRRPDLDFPVRLSDAEVAVVRQLIAGRTHAQISDDRATSPRTVANQLATAFRKFGVSGRLAIVQQLIAHSLQYRPGRTGSASAEAPLLA